MDERRMDSLTSKNQKPKRRKYSIGLQPKGIHSQNLKVDE